VTLVSARVAFLSAIVCTFTGTLFANSEAVDTTVDTTTVEPKRQGDGAVYSLEFPVQCPHCAMEVSTFRVFRLLRSQVSFTSTLPRKGYVIVCPECERPISSELSGLI
jgi:hypothetical protein